MNTRTSLTLASVELVAVSSTHVALTAEALAKSMQELGFSRARLLTHDCNVAVAAGIERVYIDRLDSSAAYSHFMLKKLADFVEANHALVIQWDGYVLSGDAWDPRFLNYDYIGAPWPHFADAHTVGNGGFSLRSRRLLRACQDPRILSDEAEDIVIGRTQRLLLEEDFGIRYAPNDMADRFSFERIPRSPTLGFHGFFNMIDILSLEEFRRLYSRVDVEAVGERELRDTLLRLLRRRGLGQPRLLARLFADWLAAKRRKTAGSFPSRKAPG